MEAIQHSLLGSLLSQLAWLSFFFLLPLSYRFEDGNRAVVGLLTFGGMIVGCIIVWSIGFLARATYRGVSPLGRLQEEPANGFDVWRRMPEGGLRPPGPMRRLVRALGRSPDRRPSAVFVLLVVVVFLGPVLLVVPPDWGADVFPWLDWIEHPEALIVWFWLAAVLLTIRAWASEQRANLAPLDD